MAEVPINFDLEYLGKINEGRADVVAAPVKPEDVPEELLPSFVVQFRGWIDDMCELGRLVATRFNLEAGQFEHWPYHVVPGHGFVVVSDEGEMFKVPAEEREFKPRVAFYQGYDEGGKFCFVDMWAPGEDAEGEVLRFERLPLMDQTFMWENTAAEIFDFMNNPQRGGRVRAVEISEESFAIKEIGAMYREKKMPEYPDDY